MYLGPAPVETEGKPPAIKIAVRSISDGSPLPDPPEPWPDPVSENDGQADADMDVASAMSEGELVQELTAALQAAFNAWKAAEVIRVELGAAIGALSTSLHVVNHEQVDSNDHGEKLAGHVQKKKDNRLRVVQDRATLAAKIQSARQAAELLREKTATLKTLDQKAWSRLGGVWAGKLGAASMLARELLAKVEPVPTKLDATANAQVQSTQHVDERKAPPGKWRYQATLAKLAVALPRVIDIHDKTVVAYNAATQAVYTVGHLDNQKFVEPRKPTAEEVSRYLAELDQWSREYLPAQRTAAEQVFTFRQHLAGLQVALGEATRLWRRLKYLEFRAVEHDVDSLVIGARQVLEVITLFYRNASVKAEIWRCRKFDNSQPVADQGVEEPELIEGLQLQTKNVGIAVANKCIARAKYDQIKAEPLEKPVDCPSLLTVFNGVGFDFDSKFNDAQSYMTSADETNMRIEQQRARVQMAWDAYAARCEMAREVSNKCAGTTYVLERMLKTPMSDQFRVVIIAARKLKQLHGELYGSSSAKVDVLDEQNNDSDSSSYDDR